MDWIRRNWPDLLIGLALLAVIAGIIATLMSGGSFFPFGQSPSAPISGPSQPATSSPVTPVTPGQTEPTTQPLAPDPAPQDGVTPVTPGDPAPAATSPVPEGPIATTPLTTPDGATAPATTTTPAPPATTTDTQTTDTPATTGLAALTSAYRILVGSFGVAENAERHAAAFQAQGYPAVTAQQGSVVAVLVGPYTTRTEAEAALANIRASGLEANPILFEPDAATTTTATATTATTTPATTGTTTTTPTTTGTTTTATTEPTTTAPPTAASGTYIQVGAYNSPELAQPQRDRLEQLGYSTSLRQTEGSTLLRLWVGPFESDRVAEAREQLSSLGIENFVPSQ